MREALKIIASLSLSGSLTILTLFLCTALLKTRFSRQWQYYIWLVAIIRLLLPLAPAGNPVAGVFQEPAVPQASGFDIPAVSAFPSGSPSPQTADLPGEKQASPSSKSPIGAPEPAQPKRGFPVFQGWEQILFPL